MAMTKKEREAFDAALEKAEIYGALHWTYPVKKDLPIPDSGYTEGFEVYSTSVQQTWSGSSRHGNGKAPLPDAPFRTASQRGVSLYSTRLMALRAMRHKKELEAAEELRKIDRMIAEEESICNQQ